jgi:hypothetical protein
MFLVRESFPADALSRHSPGGGSSSPSPVALTENSEMVTKNLKKG